MEVSRVQFIVRFAAIMTLLNEIFGAQTLPPGFEICKRDDPNIDECLRSSIQKSLKLMKNGVPSLQVMPIDPVSVSRLVIQDSNNSPVSINLDLTDVKMHGLSEATITHVKSDLNKRFMEVYADVPLLTMDADYVMDGKFLLFPLKGNGKLKTLLYDSNVKLTIQAEPMTKRGNIHWKVNRFDVDVKKTKKFESRFQNLFNGDRLLGKTTNDALNTNWLTFWEELRPTMEETFGAVFMSLANSFLSGVPEINMFT